MIKKLYYLISLTIIKALLLVSGAMIGLDFFIQCLHELHHISPTYTLGAATFYVLLRLPGDIYRLLTPIVLMGVLTGMSIMAHSRELLAMRIAGASPRIILTPIWGAGMLAIVGLTGMGEITTPTLNTWAAHYKQAMAQPHQTTPLPNAGLWLKSPQDIIYIKTVFSKNTLLGLSRYHIDASGKLSFVAYAKKAIQDQKSGQWVFYGVDTRYLLPNKTTHTYQEKTLWPITLNKKQLVRAQTSPQQQTLLALYQYAPLKVFLQRVSQPLIAWIILLITVPLVLFLSWRQCRYISFLPTALGMGLGLALYSATAFIV